MGALQGETIRLKESAEGIERSMQDISSAATAVAKLSGRNRSAISAVERLLDRYVLA
jgi:putative heme degradation protein